MSDHIGESNGMICPHCGLPFVREQNDIRSFGCGSSYCESFRPQWARSMTCLEIQNGQLQERIKRLEEAGDELCVAALYTGWNERVEAWKQAKEDKP